MKYENSDAATLQDAPLKCPKCGCTDLDEVSDGVITRWRYEWDELVGRFKLCFKAGECYGYTELQCANCGHPFEQEEYDKFGEYGTYESKPF